MRKFENISSQRFYLLVPHLAAPDCAVWSKLLLIKQGYRTTMADLYDKKKRKKDVVSVGFAPLGSSASAAAADCPFPEIGGTEKNWKNNIFFFSRVRHWNKRNHSLSAGVTCLMRLPLKAGNQKNGGNVLEARPFNEFCFWKWRFCFKVHVLARAPYANLIDHVIDIRSPTQMSGN